jgi:hypothetical protein
LPRVRTRRPSGLHSSRGRSTCTPPRSTDHHCSHGCSWESSNYAANRRSTRTHRLDRHTRPPRWRRMRHPIDQNSRMNRSGTPPCSRFRPHSLLTSAACSNSRRADRRIGRRFEQPVAHNQHPIQFGSSKQSLDPHTLGCSSQACRSQWWLDARCSNYR